MANANLVFAIRTVIADFEKVDIEKILRKGLGEESLEKDFSQRWAKIQKLLSFVKSFADQVHDETIDGIIAVLRRIFTLLIDQAGRNSSDFISQRHAFLANIDDQLEQSRKWMPPFVSAAVVERGFLEDEGIRHEYERTIESMKSETSKILATVKEEADSAIAGAKALAEQIEARARRTASGISIHEAQTQFQAAVVHSDKKARFWGKMVAVSIGMVLAVTAGFMAWPLPSNPPPAPPPSWADHLYHTVLRVIVLSAVAGLATMCVRMFRAYMHMREMNDHRLRVAKSAEGFVNSAADPSQRDLILAKIMESIVQHGDMGIIKGEKDEAPTTGAADVIGRILGAIAQKK